jgi:comEA protein
MLRRLPAIVVTLVLLSAVVPAWATKKPPATPVNLNTATSEELQQVPGIGPSTADKILQFRKSYGAFKSVDDLRAVRGIGPKRLEKMRKYLLVGKPAGGKPPAQGKSAPARAISGPPATNPPAKPAPPAPKPASDPKQEDEEPQP